MRGLAAVTQRHNAPSTFASLSGHRASAPCNSDCRLTGASRHTYRPLRNTLARLAGTLHDALANGCGALDGA